MNLRSFKLYELYELLNVYIGVWIGYFNGKFFIRTGAREIFLEQNELF